VRQARQLDDLNTQVEKVQKDNQDLRDQLAKVQEENNNLKGYNDVLKKALETAKVTGKVPEIMPYPPK
jgi:regulator of replication initiation timing